MSRSLLAAWRRRSTVKNPLSTIEVHLVEDIFSFASRSPFSGKTSLNAVQEAENFVDTGCSTHFLVNSANEGLVGIQYPTFPLGGYGGKCDSLGNVTNAVPFRSPKPGVFNWCRSDGVSGSTKTFHHSALGSDSKFVGMDEEKSQSQREIFFATDCVDGSVHHFSGGADLLEHLEKENPPLINLGGHDVRCPPGTAVFSPAFGDLRSTFDGGVFHAVSPFCLRRDANDMSEWSSSYYQPILDAALERASTSSVNPKLEGNSSASNAQDAYAFLFRHALADGRKSTANPFLLLRCCYLHVFCQVVAQIAGGQHRIDADRTNESTPTNQSSDHSLGTMDDAGGDLDRGRVISCASLTSPLLGTGVRGWPLNQGARAAAIACNSANETFSYIGTSSDFPDISLRLTIQGLSGDVSTREIDAVMAFQDSIDIAQFTRDF